MASTPCQVIFLAGSPEADALDWTEEGLTSSFEPSFLRFLDEAEQHQVKSALEPSSSFSPVPKWRQLPLRRGSKRSRSESISSPSPEPTSFPTAHKPELASDHPLIARRSPTSSQIQPWDESSAASTSLSSAASAPLPEPSSRLPEPKPGPITDLNRLPSAQHISALFPSTLTVNILCSIVSLQPARNIPLRRRSSSSSSRSNTASVDLVSALVADETRTAFPVSFWLRPGNASLRSALAPLRPGDVVLISRLALTQFRGCVRAHSLGSRTALYVFPAESEARSAFPAKLARVRAWAEQFLPRRIGQEAELSRKKMTRAEVLPPETQEWEAG